MLCGMRNKKTAPPDAEKTPRKRRNRNRQFFIVSTEKLRESLEDISALTATTATEACKEHRRLAMEGKISDATALIEVMRTVNVRLVQDRQLMVDGWKS